MSINFFKIILVLCRTKLENLYRHRGPQLRMVEVRYTGKTILITIYYLHFSGVSKDIHN
jgi:hypothetical protein